jgi:hypothetical protein
MPIGLKTMSFVSQPLGMFFYLGGWGAILWHSRKQAMVVFLLTKYEYIYVVFIVKKTMWLH